MTSEIFILKVIDMIMFIYPHCLVYALGFAVGNLKIFYPLLYNKGMEAAIVRLVFGPMIMLESIGVGVSPTSSRVFPAVGFLYIPWHQHRCSAPPP